MMEATKTREFALRELNKEHEAVRALIDTLTEEEMTRPDTIEHGLYSDQELSFKDLLAHLTTYEAYTLEAMVEWGDRRKHWIVDGTRSGSTDVEVHYQGIATRRPYTLEKMLDEWNTTQATLEQALQDLTETDWQLAPPFENSYPLNLGGMIEMVLCMPPRPPYRHLPVHVPDTDAYVRKLKRGARP
jgi:hypothetical protein